MDNTDIIKDKFKFRVAISKIKEEDNMAMSKKRNFMSKKIGLVACACLILITGGVFAKDIENFIKEKFGLGKGVETAVENGYIGNIDEQIDFTNSEVSITKGNSKEVLDTFNTGVRIKDFIMTDSTLTFNIEIKFDEKINNYKELNKRIRGNVDYEGFGNIELGLFVLDEDNKLICAQSNKEEFNNFCVEHNLRFEYLQFNDNYLNSVANCKVKEINPEANTINLTCVINGDEIPKSKELSFILNKITFFPRTNLENNSEYIYLSGNWNIELNVPEFMYNRKDIFYKVISCESEDFDIYTAKATEIGFEIGIIVSNIELPNVPTELINPSTELPYIFNSRDELEAVSTDSKFEEMYIEYVTNCKVIRNEGYSGINWLPFTDGSYILDSNGKKFEVSSNNTKKTDANFVYSDKSADRVFLNQFSYYDEFNMTKYDATDKITMFIDFYGKPVKIELEKMKN